MRTASGIGEKKDCQGTESNRTKNHTKTKRKADYSKAEAKDL